MKNQRNNKILLTVFAILTGFFISTNLFSQESDLLSKVRANDIDAVKTILAAGANVNQVGDDMMGYTALGLSKDIEMMRVLISTGAKL